MEQARASNQLRPDEKELLEKAFIKKKASEQLDGRSVGYLIENEREIEEATKLLKAYSENDEAQRYIKTQLEHK